MCVEVSCIVDSVLLMLVLETLITSSAYLNHPVTGTSKDQRMKLLADQQDWKESVLKVSAPAVASLCTHQNDVKEYLEPVLNFMAEATKMEMMCNKVRGMNIELPLLRAIFKHSNHLRIVRPISAIIANICSCCTDGYKETLARSGTIAVLSNVVKIHKTDSKVRQKFVDLHHADFWSNLTSCMFRSLAASSRFAECLPALQDGLKHMLQLSGMSDVDASDFAELLIQIPCSALAASPSKYVQTLEQLPLEFTFLFEPFFPSDFRVR